MWTILLWWLTSGLVVLLISITILSQNYLSLYFIRLSLLLGLLFWKGDLLTTTPFWLMRFFTLWNRREGMVELYIWSLIWRRLLIPWNGIFFWKSYLYLVSIPHGFSGLVNASPPLPSPFFLMVLHMASFLLLVVLGKETIFLISFIFSDLKFSLDFYWKKRTWVLFMVLR